MLLNTVGKVAILGVFIGLVSCGSQQTQTPTPTPSATPAAQKALVIADVSNNPAKKIKRFQPMADYLAANLKQFGFGVGEVKVASDLDTIASWIKAGEVDVYFDSPYPAMIMSDKTGAQPILRRWKNGQPDYYTVIFTMKERGIKSLAELKGKTIGFDEISSTTGYLLPMTQLMKAGLKPVEKSPKNDVVKADEVGYVFSDDDENTIQWVINGKVAAGAVDINSFMEVPEESRKAMTILAESEKVARHVVMVKPGMNPKEVEAIKAALIGMDKTPQGKTVLKEFEETAKFDEFPTQADIDKMRKLYEQVKNR